MPEASFEIAKGHVEIGADVDRRSVRRTSGRVTDEVDRTLRGRRSKSRIARAFSAMFTANPALLSAMRTGVPAVLASPVGLAAITLAGSFALAFVGALASSLLVAGLPAVFLGLGAFLLKDNKRIVKGFTNLGDRIKKAFKGVAKPLIEPMLDAMRLLGDAVERVAPLFKTLFEAFAPAIVPLTEGIIGFVENFLKVLVADPKALQAMTDALILMGENLPRIGEALGKFFTKLANNEDTVDNIGALFSILINALNVFGAVLSFWSSGFAFWVDQWHNFQNTLGTVWDWLSGTFWPGLVGLWDAIWGAGVTAVNGIKTAWNTTIEFFATIGDEIGAFVGRVVDWFQKLPGRLMSFIKSLPGRVNQAFLNLFDLVTYSVGYGIGLVVGFFMRLPGRVMSAIRRLPGLTADLFRTVRNRMRDITSSAVSAVVSFFSKLPGRAYNAARAIVSRIAGIFNDARSGARSRASSLVSGVVSILRNLPGRAASAVRAIGSRMAGVIRGAGGAIYRAGQALIRSLVNGIGSLVGWATGMARRAIDNIVSGIKDALPGSPVKRGPLTVLNNGYAGRQIVRMITEGMNDEMVRLRTGFESALGSAAAPVTRPAPAPAAGPTYNFAPGSVVLDASKLKSIEDLMRILENLRVTARQHGARTVMT